MLFTPLYAVIRLNGGLCVALRIAVLADQPAHSESLSLPLTWYSDVEDPVPGQHHESWRHLDRQSGALTDPTLPAPRGRSPGHGSRAMANSPFTTSDESLHGSLLSIIALLHVLSYTPLDAACWQKNPSLRRSVD